MAEIEWKGLIWRSAYGNYSYKELLTILKGFGSMEIVAFEKPWVYHGIASIELNQEGGRNLTIYYLEVLGPKKRGTGRKALQELKEIFKGKIVVQDPGEILCSEYSIIESLFFWVKMFQEGLIEELESDHLVLRRGMGEQEIEIVKKRIAEKLKEFKNKEPYGKG
ncbi:MAG: hypothetical protein N2260_06375 [Syntrophobacterales bacterium]|nr:hypothetical protein [Syntrophobacterales bacterium]